MADALAIVSREEIYAATGVQFMPINTIYQLFAASRQTPSSLDAAERFVMIPDLFNLLAHRRSVLRVHRRLDDAADESADANVGGRLDGAPESAGAPRCADCGSRIDHRPHSRRCGCAASALAGTPVVASASHDTASAVAAITARDGTAFISSGTWSLVGTELDAPVLTPRAMRLNFSNEGGVEGTTRLLKNVMGLWLLQGCRRSWAQQDRQFTYGELMDAAAREPGFRHLIDPDDAVVRESRRHAGRDRSVLPQNGSARSGHAGRLRAGRVRQPGVEVPPRHPRSPVGHRAPDRAHPRHRRRLAESRCSTS